MRHAPLPFNFFLLKKLKPHEARHTCLSLLFIYLNHYYVHQIIMTLFYFLPACLLASMSF